MSFLGKIVPLILLFVGLGIAAFIGYAAYTIATDIAEKTSQKMEKKNVSFGKEGMKIGIKEVKTENYVDQTQRYPIHTAPCATPQNESYAGDAWLQLWETTSSRVAADRLDCSE